MYSKKQIIHIGYKDIESLSATYKKLKKINYEFCKRI